jgi:hypothetical protein
MLLSVGTSVSCSAAGPTGVGDGVVSGAFDPHPVASTAESMGTQRQLVTLAW